MSATVASIPLGARRWRIEVELPPGTAPTDLALRPAGGDSPPARIEAIAAPLPSAAGRWTVVVAIEQGGIASAEYVLEASGTAPWSADVRLGPGTLTVPALAREDPQPRPDIDYRARDFTALRTMLTQRMREQTGAALEDHPVAQTTALVELLAYLGDDLSYYLDAVATEAYLATARGRISAVRHAQLLDYPVFDGRSARVWVRIEATAPAKLPARSQLLTRVEGQGPALSRDKVDLAIAAGALVFETLSPVEVLPGDRVFSLDGDERLAAGATEATVIVADADPEGLARNHLVLIAPAGEERPSEGHVVRLTEASLLGDDGTMRLAWAKEDRLPADSLLVGAKLCVRAGNLVLAEHARTHAWTPVARPQKGVRYGPELPLPHVSRTLGTSEHDTRRSAAATLVPPDRASRPDVVLREGDPSHPRYWRPVASLMSSDPFEAVFVVEVESDASASLRFGDDTAGLSPAAGAQLAVRQRTGGGAAGNVGPGALRHVVDPPTGVAGATNVAAARLGADPETLSSIRLHAPDHFRVNERAVTVSDYAGLARAVTGVADAAALLTSGGSGPVAVVWVFGGGWAAPYPALLQRVRAQLAARTPAGIALDVRPAVAMPARAELSVTAAPGWAVDRVGGDIDRALAPWLPGRSRFRFGTALHRSELVAAVAAVDGVADVTVTRLRWAHEADAGRRRDALVPGHGRIIRIDDDPATPALGLVEYRIAGLAA